MNYTTIALICECDHVESDHTYGATGSECAYGWTGEPDEEECDCEQFVYHADLVAPVKGGNQ